MSVMVHDPDDANLVETNLPGVRLFKPLPPELNIVSASPRELARYGVLLPRPRQEAPAHEMAAWARSVGNASSGPAEFKRGRDAMLSRFQRLQPRPGVTHHLRRARPVNAGFALSDNWNGPVVTGNWVIAQGVFVVPTVYPPFDYPPGQIDNGFDASIWVGLDGWGTNDVLQAGVATSIDASGRASYTPWFEWFRDHPENIAGQFPYVYQTDIPVAVAPGDAIQIIVAYQQQPNPTSGLIFFNNISRNLPPYYAPPFFGYPPFVLSLAVPTGADAMGNCAEWIVETPGWGDPPVFATLPNFGTVNFSDAVATSQASLNSDLNQATIFDISSAGKTILGDLFPYETVTGISSSTSAAITWVPPILPPFV
jgi:hypothetical protein